MPTSKIKSKSTIPKADKKQKKLKFPLLFPYRSYRKLDYHLTVAISRILNALLLKCVTKIKIKLCLDTNKYSHLNNLIGIIVQLSSAI